MTTTTKLSAIALFAVLPATLAIIQGEPAAPEYAASYAAVSIASLRTCGAVAIDPTHVVTGAHCLSIGGIDFADIANSLGLLGVAHGNVTPESADQTVSVSDIIVHPDYKFDLDTGSITNDVAVIVLEDKLDNNGGAFAEISPAVPSRGVAVGLGMNDLYDLGQPDQLYQVSLDVLGVDDGRIIAGRKSPGPSPPSIPSICWGDSGGGFYEPVAADDNRAIARVFGLVSFEPEPSRCAEGKTVEQYFTNLVYYREWIDTQISAS